MQRVVVVDDHRVFAELLELAMQAEPDLQVVGHAQTVAAGLEMVEQLHPDVVIMDVQLGDGDGIAAAAELTGRDPALRVVVLTAHVDPELMRRAAEADACALLPKDGDLAGMLEVLRTAARGSFAIHPELLHRLVSRSASPEQPLPVLTRREREVLQLLASGLETRLIARELGVSVHTCRGYVKAILAKLEAHSQLEAVARAMRFGLIDVGIRS